MTNSPRETATLTLDALVKEHNVLVGLAAENIQLRQELSNLQVYVQQLEALLAEAVGEENHGSEEATVPPEEGPEGPSEGEEANAVREESPVR